MEQGQHLVDELLGAIEQQELRSLRWGYVDGSLSEEDVDSLAKNVTTSAEITAGPIELVEWMVEHSLLFEFPSDQGHRFRSRFAEGVRLLTRLKQLLPGRSWIASPDLVSDYRVDARKRSLPRRDFDLDNTIRELEGLPSWGERQRDLITAFIGHRNLSGFQIKTAQAILRPAQQDIGTVLTAGTGSGKTLAFYLPVMMELSAVMFPGNFWTKAVAVFPRIELLKDQFSQAHNLLSPLGTVLKAQGSRPFRLGTFFSGTPFEATTQYVESAGWNRRGAGYICPFLSCPVCGGALLWSDQHIANRTETLQCEEGCGTEVNDDEVVLTRSRARREPPDIVFTTAETLNQRLSDTRSRHVLGIADNPAFRARFLLLDEIHTYGGTSGAQTALVIRRWRHAIGMSGRIRYVGLSATLEDASRFFADLTGLRHSAVSEVSPQDDELEFQSMEYQLVLRGDPGGRTQLLSTTIQTSFLLARLLDPLGKPSPSQGTYGSRIFAFTDDLDATNRLFDFLRDAEARDIFGHPDGTRIPLAGLRRTNQTAVEPRMRAGQDWERLERLGRPLTQRLNIGRTSSQDRGVDTDADIIVATAALEVGFNDPSVGAIIQHKSPHQFSTFVQRKGRAGRIPSMRPWTITVLSDFGRDRSTYQSYDRLFDPIISPLTLPIRNRYVLRMQAAFAFLDWLATSNRELRGWWWQPVNGPVEPNSSWMKQQQRIVDVLREVLDESGPLRQSLSDHVRRALRLESQEEINDILWGHPRSLLLEVLPTLARRLETGWELHPALQGAPSPDLSAGPGVPHPLPDYLPANLFSDLNLPEVEVVLPPATRRHSERIEYMPISQALGRLAPGRVTRRFAPERGGLNHWIPVPLEDREYCLPIGEYAERYELVANIPVDLDGTVTEVPCYRPRKIRMQSVRDSEVRPTSNGWQEWRTQILPTGEPVMLSTGHDPLWGQVMESVEFYMHGFHSPVTVRRFALEARSTVKAPMPSRTEFNVVTRYVQSDGDVAAVGFEQEVDAVRIALHLPGPAELTERAAYSRCSPAWRAAYFRDLVLEDKELSLLCNWFQRDWLQQMLLVALVESAVSNQGCLSVAFETFIAPRLQSELRNVAARVLEIELDIAVEDDEEMPTETAGRTSEVQMDQRWADLLENDAVTNRLLELTPNLWEPDPQMWGRWLFQRIHETLGEALLAAAQGAAPEHLAEGSLFLDLDRGDPYYNMSEGSELWLSEATLGGSGAVEALARTATEDPRLIIRALEAAVAPGGVELTAKSLEELIDLFVEDQQIRNAVEEVRRRTGHDERVAALESLFRLAAARGIPVDQGLKVAVNHRILRVGTGPQSDTLIRDLVSEWRDWEARLEVAIDVRTFSLIAASHGKLGPRIRALVDNNTPGAVTTSDAAGVIAGILWPRTGEVLGRTFQSYRQYRTQGHTDPSLISELVLWSGLEPVKYGSEGWNNVFTETLATAGIARLKADREQEADFHQEIFRILANPVDVDYLQLYPVISEVKRGRGVTVTFAFTELY